MLNNSNPVTPGEKILFALALLRSIVAVALVEFVKFLIGAIASASH